MVRSGKLDRATIWINDNMRVPYTEYSSGSCWPSRGRSIGRKLDEVIATLPSEFRELLILHEMEDMSYRDIAQATGAPIGTVMSRLARARAMLKEKWLSDVEGVPHAVR